MSGRKVEIFDTTLRDGEQSPRVSFSLEDKLKIASKLSQMKVGVIEAGFPVNSGHEEECVKRVVDILPEGTTVCALARVKEKDIQTAFRTGAQMIHVFVSTSDIQIEKSLRSSREQVLKMAKTSIAQVKNQGRECMFSPMDATRTDPDFLIQACQAAEQAGTDIINLPDTVGIAHPALIENMVSKVKGSVDIPISIHCHNDFGLAVANSLAAVGAGADMVQVSANGIGERAGNASLEEVVMGLEKLLFLPTGLRTELIYEMAKLVERLSEIPINPHKPVIGEHVFSHESGIHAAGIIEDTRTFEPGVMTPESVGHKRKLIIGKHTGKHSVKSALKDAGLTPTDQELTEITLRTKKLAHKGKRIAEADLYAIASSVISSVPQKESLIQLDQISVMTGNRLSPMASIRARIFGKEKIGTGTGVGPVDAAMQAVRQLVASGRIDLEVEISDFHLAAISGGSDSIADVTVAVEDENGLSADATAADEDIVVAGVKALVSAINHLVRKRDELAEPAGVKSEGK